MPSIFGSFKLEVNKMSTFNIEFNEFKGFQKTYWASREVFHWNTHMTPARPNFARVNGKHKRIGWQGAGCTSKQFDANWSKIFRHFNSRTPLPFRCQANDVNFHFGKIRHKFFNPSKEWG